MATDDNIKIGIALVGALFGGLLGYQKGKDDVCDDIGKKLKEIKSNNKPNKNIGKVVKMIDENSETIGKVVKVAAKALTSAKKGA